MTGAAALKVKNAGYWSFLDALTETEPVRKIMLMQSRGEALIAELKRCPDIDFGSFKIDFNADDWDFTKITSLNVEPSALRFHFDRGAMTDELKLYVITSIMWRRAKVQTIKGKFLTIERAVDVLGLAPENVRLLTKERVEGYLMSLRSRLAPATLGQCAANLRGLLDFHERLFGRIVDPDTIAHLADTASRCAAIAAAAEGYPRIPPEYEEQLIDVAEAVMRDRAADPTDGITAAAMLILHELAFRSGELRGLEAYSIEVIEGAAGMPDIAYLTFKTYKGEPGNGAYRLRRTVLSPRALEAYLFLEAACEDRRRTLGVRTLIAYPQQRATFCSGNSLVLHIRSFLVKHSREIPCINTSALFPELPTMVVHEAVKRTSAVNMLSSLGVGAGDTLVYVTPHMFRVSFATRLYEAGYDLSVISQFMNHISPDVSIGYIRSEREIEREASELVYRALLMDEAELLGPHGEEFTALVKGHAEHLKGTVCASDEELIAACSERYPLRLKVGYVCTKCGNVRKCPSDSDTDEVFCAFGVCQNQHHMYFMVDVHLEAVRFHMRLVEENRRRGHAKAADNELRKARNVIEGTVLPELESLAEQVSRHGEDHVIERHPHLLGIISARSVIEKEVRSWLTIKPAN